MAGALRSLLFGLIVVAVLAPFGIWAVGFAKRQRGIAAAATGLLLIFGLSMQITPPPPPVAEQPARRTEEDDEDDGE